MVLIELINIRIRMRKELKMPAIEPLCHLIGINSNKFSKEEIFILEAELLIHICYEIKEFYRDRYKNYFRLMKFTIEMENAMLDANYIRFAINDILLTEEYTLSGIAYYTQTPEDIIYEVVTGSNTRPSATFLQKIIELHREVKRDLYDTIIKKVYEQHLSAA